MAGKVERALLLGGGGHARVAADVARAMGLTIVGIVAPDAPAWGGLPWLGGDEAVAGFNPADVVLINGTGAVRAQGPDGLRRRLFDSFRTRGYRFATLVHPSTVIAPDVALEEGAQVFAGAVLQPGCRIGANAIVNTRAGIDHDTDVGAYAHIAPGATLCGGVIVGEGALVGAGATVLPGVRIGARAVLAGGAVATADVPDGATARGVPARCRE
ncbi:MAG TPA: acetyltransferase [Azospirillum sp.]|nr:acetyltransferase [Azospirillum sp.]